MSEREAQLLQRRRALQAHCAVQRRQMSETAAHIEERLGGLDRGIDIARNAVHSPFVIAGAISVLVLIGPRRLLRWVTRGAVLWSTSRRLMRLRKSY